MDEQLKIPEKPPVSREQHLCKLYVCRERDRETVKHIEWDIY